MNNHIHEEIERQQRERRKLEARETTALFICASVISTFVLTYEGSSESFIWTLVGWFFLSLILTVVMYIVRDALIHFSDDNAPDFKIRGPVITVFLIANVVAYFLGSYIFD